MQITLTDLYVKHKCMGAPTSLTTYRLKLRQQKTLDLRYLKFILENSNCTQILPQI